MSYNGYSNYETWNINSWCCNTESINRMRKSFKTPWSIKRVCDFINIFYPNGTPDMSNEQLEKINWEEIVNKWNGE